MPTGQGLDRLASFLVARRALLWMVSDSAPESDATKQLEDKLAGYYWEACWTESTRNHLYDAAVRVAEGSEEHEDTKRSPRLPYRFSGKPDGPNDLRRARFLPFYELNGTERGDDPDGRSDAPAAVRDLFRLSQMQKLQDFPGRGMLVVGANSPDELRHVRAAMAFAPRGFELFVLADQGDWDGNAEFPDHVAVTTIQAGLESLLESLASLHAPLSTSTALTGVRYGPSSEVEVDETQYDRILEEFVVVTTKDFEAPSGVASLDSLGHLQHEDDWTPFAMRVPFERHYEPEPGQSLVAYILGELGKLQSESVGRNLTVNLPATSGSGVTTTLRAIAYEVAERGFPSLVARRRTRDFSVERVWDFLTTLRESSNSEADVPALIVLDRQQLSAAAAGILASSLGARGRPVLVVRVVPPGRESPDDPDETTKASGPTRALPPFRGAMVADELRALVDHFGKVFGSRVDLPELAVWEAFELANRLSQRNVGAAEVESLFWVALRFFLPSASATFSSAEWLKRICEDRIDDEGSRRALRALAAFSTYGLPLPLGLVFRLVNTPISPSSPILSHLERLSESEEVLQWLDPHKAMSEQLVGFGHRLLASEFLRAVGAEHSDDPLDICGEVLQSLRPNEHQDEALLQDFVFEALRPAKAGEETAERLKRKLATYGEIPSVLAERASSVQHHWGRALYSLARKSEEGSDLNLLREALGKLSVAAQLSSATRRGDHPRNILNTIGTVRAELSRAHRLQGNVEQADAAWDSAATAFERALALGGDNVVILSAYARRLVDRAQAVLDVYPDKAVENAASATVYLIQALSIPGLGPDDEDQLYGQLGLASSIYTDSRVADRLSMLRSEAPATAAAISATRLLSSFRPRDWGEHLAEVEKAHAELEAARSEAARAGWRYWYLLYRTSTLVPARRFDFAYRRATLEELARTQFHWDVTLRFAHAVLCFQTDDYPAGHELFRQLREDISSGKVNPRTVTSFWRSPESPTEARIVPLRIDHIDSDSRGYGVIQQLGPRQIPLTPRQFRPLPVEGEVVTCQLFLRAIRPTLRYCASG